MKNPLLLLLFILSSFAASAQKEKEKELSNAEQLSLKSGVLIQRDYLSLGALKGAKFELMTITDMLSSHTTKALKIEMSVQKSYGAADKTAILDADEVDGFLKSLNLIQEKILLTSPSNYTEVEYKSRGGFKGGCFSDVKKGWSFFIKLDKYDSDSYLFLKKEELPALIKIFEETKSKL